MALLVVSNAFLLTVVIGYVLFRLFCEFSRETHLRPRLPSDVHFTTSTITNDITTPTGKRTSLKSLIDDLMLHGDDLAVNLEPIRIIYDTVDRKWRSLDNRRLYALKKAEEWGAISSVRYVVMDLDQPEVAEEYMSKKGHGRVTNQNPDVKVLEDFEWDVTYSLR